MFNVSLLSAHVECRVGNRCGRFFHVVTKPLFSIIQAVEHGKQWPPLFRIMGWNGMLFLSKERFLLGDINL